jgi:hypothetical protein
MSYGIPFIDVQWNDQTSEKLLVVSNENICNVYIASRAIFNGTTGRHLRGGFERFLHNRADSISASSYLEKNNISYNPRYDSNRRSLFQPLWIEGTNEHGINQKLFITAKASFAIHISIGNVSYINPQLYYEYSRPKRIRLFVENSFTIDIDLEDTPNYQMIYLPNPLRAEDILVLEILDVYPGTKYANACINEIYYDRIPWQNFDLAVGFDYIPWQDWLNTEWFISKNDLVENVLIIEDEIEDNNEIIEEDIEIIYERPVRIWIWLFIPIIISSVFFIIFYKKKRKQ